MALEVTGKLIKVLNPQSGTGAKGNWVKQEFVIETADQYPKKICFSLWGDKTDSLKNFSLGDEIKVSFNPASREYNERWYTDLRAWRIDAGGSGNKSGGGPKGSGRDVPPPPSFEPSDEAEDLPF